MNTKSKMIGVTLIELMVVVAIVGILGTIANSSYHRYLLQAHRSEGQIALMTVRVEQEKFFLQNRSYANAATLLNVASPTQHGYYIIGVSTSNAGTRYVATATAAGAQVDDTTCKTLTVDWSGVQSSTDSSNSASTGCWK
jgi:type IV pilus assembly protein PilE